MSNTRVKNLEEKVDTQVVIRMSSIGDTRTQKLDEKAFGQMNVAYRRTLRVSSLGDTYSKRVNKCLLIN